MRYLLSILTAVLALLLFTAAAPTLAQETTPEPAPEATVEAQAPTELPPSARLDGLTLIWQDINRCSAAALSIQISYFGHYVYDAAVRELTPHIEDVAVRLDEMIRFAADYGLLGIERYGGTLDMLKALVAGGFPVLIENSYYDGGGGFRDWMGHNRVVMGYDDAQQVILTFDSLLGAGPDQLGRPIPYADVADRWRAFNYDYLVLYRPEDEEKLRAIMGDHWDATYNAEWALQLAQTELQGESPDTFSLFNLGSSLVMLGRYEEAIEAFERAREIGLPWRMMWYQYGPFEAYINAGRYQDALTLAQQVIATTPGVEEAYYYAGLAYEGLGDMLRAESNFEVALMRNIYFTAASDALARVRGDTAQAAGS